MSDTEHIGFGLSIKNEEDYPMEFISHHLIGGNADDKEGGYWNTKEDALINFALQFAELADNAQHHFLFVRRAPHCFQDKQFGDDIKYRMIGRFCIAKLKEKNDA